MIFWLRKIYRRFIHWSWLDQKIYNVLDFFTDLYSYFKNYSFPKNYIRKWKLNMLFRSYEKETVVLFKKIIKPGTVIMDIGAHIGYFTRLFSKLTGPKGMVYAFEADPENFQLLKRNTNHLKNVKIYQLAITDQFGAIDFYHYDEKTGCNSILSNAPVAFQKRKITVSASDLDTILKTEGVNRVDLIKMDIEGGESKALVGMQKTIKENQPLAIVLEFAPAWIKAAGSDPNIFLKNLESWEFKIFAIQNNILIQIGSKGIDFKNLLPKTPTHYNEFLNLYCAKKK